MNVMTINWIASQSAGQKMTQVIPDNYRDEK